VYQDTSKAGGDKLQISHYDKTHRNGLTYYSSGTYRYDAR